MTDDAREGPSLISLAAEIVSAFVANNAIGGDEVAKLIRQTHRALASFCNATGAETPSEPPFTRPVSIRRSLASRDRILSMIDGKPYQALRRHIEAHGFTPAEYRARYRLPKNYPMVAPALSEVRRATALRIGLGKIAADARAKKQAMGASTTPAGRKRGRAAKASKR